jgi:N-formylglutamate amidohydrolase
VEEMDEGVLSEIRRRSSSVVDPAGHRSSADELRARREQAGEPYCEYFRRQLERIECVEDLLAELE